MPCAPISTFSRLELQLRVLFVCFGPLVLTTSKILKGLGGFPELQIPTSQKHRFQLTILPGICGVSSLGFFQHAILKVAIIPSNFDQVTYVTYAILNITLGLMQKYIAFYEAKPEFTKYVGNMKDFCRIVEIPRV